MQQDIETIYDASGLRRITIILLDGGRYTIRWAEYVEDPYGWCWVPGCHGMSAFDNLETAQREARARLGLRPD
jgi:hypothetical protein